MNETNEQRMQRIADEEQAVAAMRRVCDAYQSGTLSFRQTVKAVEDVIEDQAARIVRVGKIHTPEVQS